MPPVTIIFSRSAFTGFVTLLTVEARSWHSSRLHGYEADAAFGRAHADVGEPG